MPKTNKRDHWSKADAYKAAKFCEESKSESSLAVLARFVLDDFDTAPQSSEYVALRSAFRKTHGVKAWNLLNEIVQEFRWFRR